MMGGLSGDRSRISLRDLLGEATAGAFQRPWRAVLTAVGTIIGVAAFIAVLGITSTAQGQISARFNDLVATEVIVEDVGGATADLSATLFPADADKRAMAIPGVRNAGLSWQVPANPPLQVTTAAMLGSQSAADDIAIVAASPGFLPALRPVVLQGRLFEDVHNQRREQVAIIGPAVASRLGVSNLNVLPAILIDGIPFTVMGILGSVERSGDVLSSIVIPAQTAGHLWGPPDASARATMVVDTNVGAAQMVGSQLPIALRPDAPDHFRVITPPDPRTLREGLETDLGALFLLLALLSLVVGAVGIANTTLVAVLERVPEIGLRRALGARRRHVAAQFLVESSMLGALGGVVGASLGIVTVVSVAAARQWTPVVEPWMLLVAPVIGAAVGLLVL